jgi:DNA mismatch endonuclease (patch repair protein)
MAIRASTVARLTLTQRMQRIRKTDTKPEIMVRRLVHAMGYRYRLHQSDLPGSPDIVFNRHRKVIFVHGCFWHRHDCPDGRKLPKSKPEYWTPKLERNRRRDEASIARLHELGWRVLVVWECEITNRKRLKKRLVKFLSGRFKKDLSTRVPSRQAAIAVNMNISRPTLAWPVRRSS